MTGATIRSHSMRSSGLLSEVGFARKKLSKVSSASEACAENSNLPETPAPSMPTSSRTRIRSFSAATSAPSSATQPGSPKSVVHAAMKSSIPASGAFLVSTAGDETGETLERAGVASLKWRTKALVAAQVAMYGDKLKAGVRGNTDDAAFTPGDQRCEFQPHFSKIFAPSGDCRNWINARASALDAPRTVRPIPQSR